MWTFGKQVKCTLIFPKDLTTTKILGSDLPLNDTQNFKKVFELGFDHNCFQLN